MRRFIYKKVALATFDGNDSITIFGVDHDSHILNVYQASQKPMDMGGFVHWVLHDRDARKELIWAVTEYHRFNKFWVEHRTGMSGCQDITLRYCKNAPDWVSSRDCSKVAIKIHISACGKLNDGLPKEIFFGDLAEVLAEYMGKEEFIHTLNNRPNRYGCIKYLRGYKDLPEPDFRNSLDSEYHLVDGKIVGWQEA